jgi:hypothetical protein
MGMDSEGQLEIRKLKRAITEAPILRHFDPAKPIILQTYGSGFGIAGIFIQYNGFGTLQLVNFYSRKFSPAE